VAEPGHLLDRRSEAVGEVHELEAHHPRSRRHQGFHILNVVALATPVGNQLELDTPAGQVHPGVDVGGERLVVRDHLVAWFPLEAERHHTDCLSGALEECDVFGAAVDEVRRFGAYPIEEVAPQACAFGQSGAGHVAREGLDCVDVCARRRTERGVVEPAPRFGDRELVLSNGGDVEFDRSRQL
jgi:hypothetical protein